KSSAPLQSSSLTPVPIGERCAFETHLAHQQKTTGVPHGAAGPNDRAPQKEAEARLSRQMRLAGRILGDCEPQPHRAKVRVCNRKGGARDSSPNLETHDEHSDVASLSQSSYHQVKSF